MKLTTMISTLALSLLVTAAAEARHFAPAPRCATPVIVTPVTQVVPVVVGYDIYGRPVIVNQTVVVQQPVVVARRPYHHRRGSYRRWWR